ADLDERRLHAREDVLDATLVDVSGDRAPLGALEVDLGNLAVLEHGDALLADVHGDEELTLRLGATAPRRLCSPSLALAFAALGGGVAAARGGLRLRLGLCLRATVRRLPPAAAASAAAPALALLLFLGRGRRGRVVDYYGLGCGRSGSLSGRRGAPPPEKTE